MYMHTYEEIYNLKEVLLNLIMSSEYNNSVYPGGMFTITPCCFAGTEIIYNSTKVKNYFTNSPSVECLE